jgi:predicted nucleotidyltransferase
MIEGIAQQALRPGLVPAESRSAYVVGSIARGWVHESSDVDIFVVMDQPWRGQTSSSSAVLLQPDRVPALVTYVDGRRWELRYWLDAQVDQMLDKVSWARFDEEGDPTVLSDVEFRFLERMRHGVALTGQEWLTARCQQLDESAFRAIAITGALQRVDAAMEDALGCLASGDAESAVLSARVAFGNAVDALLAGAGELGRDVKWRPRRMRLVQPPLLPYDRYWQLETMRELDPDNPREWVEEVGRLCQAISAEVEF